LPSFRSTFTGAGLRVWPCGRLLVAAMIALLLLPIDVSGAGFFANLFKGSSSSDAPSKRAKAFKSKTARSGAPKPVRSKPTASARPAEQPKPEATAKPQAARPAGAKCDPAKFRLVVDVGHTAKSEGAMSARNVPEFNFNLHLAQRLVEKLKSEGFGETKLLVTEGGARSSLVTRVAKANHLHADLFLSIHHDSVPDKMMENWEYEGKKSHFSDRFSGYGLFVSKDNPQYETSLRFAHLIGEQMRAQGIKFADQYTLPIMGKYRHDLLDKEAGVYRYDNLIVLMRTQMPAVLLEAGSISNRDEELQMASPERQDMSVKAVTTALKQFCDPSFVPDAPEAAPEAATEGQKKTDR
jgi:N-acetylmuramoyl-L-alanine amidase